MALTTCGITLVTYSFGSMAISIRKFLNLNSMINKTNKIETLELYSNNNPRFDVVDDYNFIGSCGTVNGKDIKNYRYIGNPIDITFICDLTKKKYEKILEKYDHESYIKNIMLLDADKKLYLHYIKMDEGYTINDKKLGFYHESKKYLSQYYIMYTRYPFTFTSGIIGGLILCYN